MGGFWEGTGKVPSSAFREDAMETVGGMESAAFAGGNTPVIGTKYICTR